MPSPPQHLALSASQQVLSVIGRDTTGQLTLSFYKLQHFFGVSIGCDCVIEWCIVQALLQFAACALV